MNLARSGDLGANEIIRLLDLKPHPEGGHYAQTYPPQPRSEERPQSTAIYYLLQADEVSAWHKVDADEYWLWHAGSALVLTVSPPDGRGADAHTLGPDLRAGQRPQFIVPAAHWQTAECLGAWCLVSCVVSPGFQFSGFQLAPDDWRPEI